jgi:hypothetical protein
VFAANLNQLQRRFDRPPDDARIMMRWWWFGPAVTKPQLECEMMFMKAGGIGGFEVQPTYPLSLDDEKAGINNLKFMSPEFLDALAFTAGKAKALGLRMDLTLGSGWPYGGPQFPASEAAGRLRTLNVRITPGQTSVPVPQVREGEQVFAAFLGPMTNVPSSSNPYREVELRANTALLPADLGGQTQITFFVASQTGMKVKRAAYGAEGFVIDHYNPTVINKFMKEIATPAVQACGPNPPYAVFCDSLEVGGEDWTFNFLEEFQKRRGYDLKPFLPALFNNIGPKTADIRHDWGKTITELYNDYFSSAFQKWAKEHQTRFRIQNYGTPPAALHSYAYADLPEGEGYTWKGFRESRWAASASHLLGRPITSSETWTWLHSPVFRASPLDMKAEADLHFLQGINQLIGHGWPYTPPSVEYPGWRFYAAAVFNEKNPWWIVMPDMAKYLQRVSYVMRQGQPANDVALYLANSDAWASFTPGRVAMNAAVSGRLGREIVRQILESGYNLDFFDDQLLELRGRVDGGALAFGNVKFPVVVLAGVERIPPATLRKFEAFAKGGGILIATRSLPALAPGFKATEEDQKTVQQLTQRLFKEPGAPGIFLESDSGFGEALARRLPPDIKFEPAAPEIGFVHRKHDAAEIYFLANTGNTPQHVKATFRVPAKQPERWDPMTGQITPVKIVNQVKDSTTVAVDLEPYGSQILVFTKRVMRVRPPTPAAPLPQAIDLSGRWNVSFGKDATPVVMDKLSSWTDHEAMRYFSGVATYEKRVTVPAEWLKKGLPVQLKLGDAQATADTGNRGIGSGGSRQQAYLEAPVREAAVVYVNGKRAGSVWCPPYRVDVTGLLKRGENAIRIDVANLAVNYMADFKKHPLPDYSALIARFGDRFQPQDMKGIQPVPAGLMGPIQLIATPLAK